MKIAEILQNPGRQFPNAMDVLDKTNLEQEIEDYFLVDGNLQVLKRILHNYIYTKENKFWIEGEFGVGKSYFLKILSNLLDNNNPLGQPLYSVILSKFEDKELELELKYQNRYPAEAVTFNLAHELTSTGSITEIFYKNIYRQLNLAEEHFKNKKAKTPNSFIGKKKDDAYSIQNLSEIVTSYLKKKDKEFRLNIFVDSVEVLQEREILDLLSVIEKLTLENKTRVSVFLASIVPVNVSELEKLKNKCDFQFFLSTYGDDKILQSALLSKKNNCTNDLKSLFNKFSHSLESTLISSPNNSRISFEKFYNFYPFLPYHVDLYRTCKFSLHRNLPYAFWYQPKYNSFAIRELFRVFSNILGRIKDKPVNKIVPFDYFFEELTHLKNESFIKKYIKSNQKNSPLEIRILKIMFMTQFSNQFQTNADGIAMLLIDDLQFDWEKHCNAIEESLDRLVEKKILRRDHDLYIYFPLIYQKVDAAIKQTECSIKEVNTTLGEILFSRILKEVISSIEKNIGTSFALKLDGSTFKKGGEILLEIISEYSKDHSNKALLQEQTEEKPELKIVLPENLDFIKKLEIYCKTIKFINDPTSSANPEMKIFLSEKSYQNQYKMEKLIVIIEKQLSQSEIYFSGRYQRMYNSGAQEKVAEALVAFAKSLNLQKN